MNIKEVTPPQQPVYSLEFTRDEGWSILMFFRDAIEKYPEAQDRNEWLHQAKELEKLLRR